MNPPSAVRRLVINADDLGLVESVNRGIGESIERGVVTSTSLMVNMPGWDDAIARLRGLIDNGLRIGVGLHFNVVAGRSLSDARTLTDARGRFRGLGGQMLMAYSGRIDPADVRGELTAQLEKARHGLTALGLRLTHIDSHRHAHCLPGFYQVVTDCARRNGITHVRHPTEARQFRIRRSARGGLLRLLLSSRVPFDAVAFAGVSAMASETFEADLLEMIERVPVGISELMVHPGYDSGALATLDSYRQPRERELKALTSPSVRARLDQHAIKLTQFQS